MTTKLFTPGPLNTRSTVREAMMEDLGSRDRRFIDAVADIRRRLVNLGGSRRFEAVPVQGSGSFAMESALDTLLDDQACLLVAVNGEYGRRAAAIAERLGAAVVPVVESPDRPVDPARIADTLAGRAGITHVWAVHCETTTGVMNDIAAIGRAARAAGCRFLVDAMSTFGGVPLNLEAAGIDVLVASANKCIEGVPGFAFLLARRELLEASAGRARSTCLDAHAQWQGLESNGQFRFTPPTHALMAFRQALVELQAEGGVAARHARYAANHRRTVTGMEELGFRTFLAPAHRSVIISTFLPPAAGAWSFDEAYAALAAEGLVLYPGKLTGVESFRIGHIGQITAADIDRLLRALRRTLP